jgi:hypothetical protein
MAYALLQPAAQHSCRFSTERDDSMDDLFIRTVSQGLQAFLPVAFCLAWFRRTASRRAAVAARWGVLAALPLTVIAGNLFQRTAHQSGWEAVLATIACAAGVWFALTVWRDVAGDSASAPRRAIFAAAVFAGTAIVIVRQTMEIAVIFAVAAFQVHSADATRTICVATAISIAISALWSVGVRRVPSRVSVNATRLFAILFVAQAALYAFHESAEARVLPWSDVLHAATEPYGPDGIYGKYVSAAIAIAPAVAALLTPIADLVALAFASTRRRFAGHARAFAGAAALAIVGILVMGVVAIVPKHETPEWTTAPAAAPAPAASAGVEEAVRLSASPHLLFRRTGVDSEYGKLHVASLASPEGGRAAARLVCDRVSFGGSRGICLHADRGVLTTYKAILFDAAFQPVRTFSLDGQPSRTRVSPDGRVGTVTVFVTGKTHGYSSASFSTKTTLIDMASGDELGDLESFATWRNGARFQNADFNFWGVTFARDSNQFYATLKTGGQTYLVKGDLGLRKLTVLRENVECPSLSPDNRLIGYKKRVGGDMAPWRFYILEVASMTEHPLADARSLDDQIEWLDNGHVLYAAARSSQTAVLDVWVAAVDGSAAPQVFLREAESPIVVR